MCIGAHILPFPQHPIRMLRFSAHFNQAENEHAIINAYMIEQAKCLENAIYKVEAYSQVCLFICINMALNLIKGGLPTQKPNSIHTSRVKGETRKKEGKQTKIKEKCA